MCIRDSAETALAIAGQVRLAHNNEVLTGKDVLHLSKEVFCLLYTSDAADERSSVDLGGRRIIKKKQRVELEDSRIEKIHRSRNNRY